MSRSSASSGLNLPPVLIATFQIVRRREWSRLTVRALIVAGAGACYGTFLVKDLEQLRRANSGLCDPMAGCDGPDGVTQSGYTLEFMLGVVITSAIFGVLLWLCVRTHPAAVVLALPLAGPAGAWMATAAHGHSTREFVAIAGVALIFGLAELVATPGRWRIHRMGAALGIVGLMIVATEVLRGAL